MSRWGRRARRLWFGCKVAAGVAAGVFVFVGSLLIYYTIAFPDPFAAGSEKLREAEAQLLRAGERVKRLESEAHAGAALLGNLQECDGHGCLSKRGV